MKTKFRHRLVAMTLAMMMTAAPVWGTAHAADEAINQPEKPVAESYMDNDKIEEYNKKVDEYNKSAEEYNKSVDKEFEEASKAADEANAQIDQQNAAEAERVRAAEERNAQAVKDADEANAQIDKDNEAEEARVKEHNANEDAKAEASVKAIKDAEDYNEAAKAHNEAVANYAEEYAKYEAANKQYEDDLKMEARILAAGYTSVQQYNDRINKAYNEPAAKAREMNPVTEIKGVSDTYKVTEAAEKSGVNVRVSVKHIFEGTDVSYSEEFTIDANDTILLNSIAAAGTATQPGYATFYHKTDDAHVQGYWYESYSVLMTTARHSEYGWNCGDEHEVSYSEGKRYASDEEDIDITYYYGWNPLRTAKIYNIPVAPTKPENPGAAKDLVEVPELYTPEYQKFEKKAYVEAQTEEIKAANILERVASPVKKAYIALLSYMDLYDVPEAEAATAEAAEEIIPAATVAADTAKAAEEAKAPAAATTAQRSKAAAASAEATYEKLEAEETMIAEQEIPMAGTAADESAWALLNLIMTVVTGIISAVLLVGFFNKKDDEEESEEEKANRRGFARLMSLIPAISAAIIFILVEDLTNPMALSNKWTVLMAAILMIQAFIAIFVKNTDKANDEEMAEAVNA